MATLKFHRIESPLEKEAYKNLKDYDGGLYKVTQQGYILNILSEYTIELHLTPKPLDIDQHQVTTFLNHAQIINMKHSDFKPGIFAERNSYEATFSKKAYFDSEIEFIISLFISHHNVHAFNDGNKRTALNLFIDLVARYTSLYIKNVLVIQDAQIMYLEKLITEDDFRKIILFEVREKVFKHNIKVNLEHLIPRSSIENQKPESLSTQSDRRSSFNLNDLEKSQFFYQQLRKPIFQRDTNQWTVERLEKLVLTFLDDGLIPAIILWEDSEGEIYIIDGAHRISSLIAWVNSDYGKENEMNESNHSVIEEYINSRIGNYEVIKKSTLDEHKPAKLIIAKRSIPVQWVTGDYEKVKESFIRINEQGVIITADEKELIENDQLPISILSRAILGHGIGQQSKHQNPFTEELFNRFFKPLLSHEMNCYPLAGSINENLVISKIYNAIKIIDNRENNDIETLITKVNNLITFLQDYLQISQKIYFYGITKLHKINSFYGFLNFTLSLVTDSELTNKFIKNRKAFEEYLIIYDNHIQVIARKKRKAKNAFEVISKYYSILLDAIDTGDFNTLQQEFNYLDFKPSKALSSREETLRSNYEKFIAETPRCQICEGYIDKAPDFIGIHKCCEKQKVLVQNEQLTVEI